VIARRFFHLRTKTHAPANSSHKGQKLAMATMTLSRPFATLAYPVDKLAKKANGGFTLVRDGLIHDQGDGTVPNLIAQELQTAFLRLYFFPNHP